MTIVVIALTLLLSPPWILSIKRFIQQKFNREVWIKSNLK